MIYKKQLITSVVVSFILLFAGCTSKNTRVLISNYAEASSNTQTNILNTYKDVIYQEQQYLYYKALRDGGSLKDITPRKINYSGQQKALKDLSEFTEALAKISSDDYLDSIDTNSAKLYSSAKSLSENDYVKNESDVSKEDIELFTTILNVSTKGYVEYIKTKHLEKLMLASDKLVQNILDNLDNDLPSWKRHLKKSLRHRKNIQLLVLNNPHTYCKLKDKNKECYILQESFKTKIGLYDEVNHIQKRIDNLNDEFKALSDSIALMSKMHKNIIKSIKGDKLDDLSLKTLKRNQRRLKELSQSINKYRKSVQG